MKFYKYMFFLLIITVLSGGYSYLPAQIEKKAQVGFRFLENPVSAEVVGRGQVGITTTYNSNGIFWNPALLGLIQSNYDVSLNHTTGIADINYNALAGTVKLGNAGVLGFSLLAMDYGDFYGTVRGGSSMGYTETGTFSPTAFSAGIAFSQAISDKFSYGVHLKYVYQDLGDAYIATSGSVDSGLVLDKRKYSSSNLTLPFAIDVGAFYDFQYNGIKFGASLQNISKEFRYENEKFPMPFSVNFGLTVEPLGFFDIHDKDHNLMVCAESRHPRDFGEKTKFGAEYKYMDMFIARVGYMTNYDGRDITAGLGVRYNLSGVPLRIDYAYEPWDIFGAVHFLSLGISY